MFGPFPLPHSLGVDTYPKSTLELRLSALSAAIRNKRDWHVKRLKPEIVATWEKEAAAQDITPSQFKFVIDELAYYDKLRVGPIEVAGVDGVWRASQLIPPDIHTKFTRMVAILADLPEQEKDWHPGSDNKVLDLVHPGLYLFVSGNTRTLQRNCQSSEPTDLPEPRNKGVATFTSTRYQWIPTPIEVGADGDVTILSYINNLHPKRYGELYDVLANILEHTLPLFERVLSFLKSDLGPKIDVSTHDIFDESDKPQQQEEENVADYYLRYDEWYENRPFNPIPIPEYTEPPTSPPVKLRNCGLQIIVKIQEIHLTPEKPTYDGGVWHVEGMHNERIVASAIFYYDCSNITDCTLSFRQAVCEPDYEQNDDRGIENMYGLLNGEPLVQGLGSIITKSGLVMAWPNVYQHRVSPFELIDKTRPGKRGILVFFLVDPDNPMEYDTQNVPAQQRDWWHEEVDPLFVSMLPPELRDLIFEWVDDPMPLQVAREHRQRSMEERKFIRDNHNDEIFEREFSLCEH